MFILLNVENVMKFPEKHTNIYIYIYIYIYKGIKKRIWKIDILKWYHGKMYSSYMKHKNMILKHLDIISLVSFDHECVH